MADALAPLERLGRSADHSWIEQLSSDPEAEEHTPNKRSREVRSGHYVRVRPTPLLRPKLAVHSADVAELLGISEGEVASEAFVAFFSGDQGRVGALESWCTPYALAIMGQPQYQNCPFGNGNGYGDGRAVSVGEVVVKGRRWEMQLKGGGTTPFCRGADGRAVLRSSIREFLASEAMHHLRVGTTRALCLTVSSGETVQRPWYSGRTDGTDWFRDPDTVINEPCAITTRVSPSFLRVGHLDLFARRATAEGSTPRHLRELEQIVEHAIFREYPDSAPGRPLPERALAMLEAAADRLTEMVSGWLRVGFCQGNFNSDNCLIGGRTMDYGPFGWIDRYDPLFAKWVGSGQHFAFMNQPRAALFNYITLVSAVQPVLGDDSRGSGQEGLKALVQRASQRVATAVSEVFRSKLGFAAPGSEAAEGLWADLEPLMRKSRVDYTILWRQLAQSWEASLDDANALFSPLTPAFYDSPSEELMTEWVAWLRRWRAALDAEGASGVSERIRAASPKYVPREWMLADAYRRAAYGDFAGVRELQRLFRRPYHEQPEFEAKYYRRTPDAALEEGGVAYMS